MSKQVNSDFTIIYMGSPDFAVRPLKALLDAGYNIPLVVSQPDKPKGRKGILTPTAVKEFALAQGIKVITPKTVNTDEVMAELAEYKPDLLVITAFGQILKEPVLKLAPKGAVNIHASLLPQYRGAAPIQQAIIDGQQYTGITTMFMDIGLDTGDMILQKVTPILSDDNLGTLRDKLADVGSELILETVDLIQADLAPREQQEHDKSTYAHKITRDTEKIDWQKTAGQIHNLIRGLAPDTSGFAFYQEVGQSTEQEKIIKIWQTQLTDNAESKIDNSIGKIIGCDKQGVLVQTGENQVLRLIEIQPAGKGKMKATDWWRGVSTKSLVLK